MANLLRSLAMGAGAGLQSFADSTQAKINEETEQRKIAALEVRQRNLAELNSKYRMKEFNAQEDRRELTKLGQRDSGKMTADNIPVSKREYEMMSDKDQGGLLSVRDYKNEQAADKTAAEIAKENRKFKAEKEKALLEHGYKMKEIEARKKSEGDDEEDKPDAIALKRVREEINSIIGLKKGKNFVPGDIYKTTPPTQGKIDAINRLRETIGEPPLVLQDESINQSKFIPGETKRWKLSVPIPEDTTKSGNVNTDGESSSNKPKKSLDSLWGDEKDGDNKSKRVASRSRESKPVASQISESMNAEDIAALKNTKMTDRYGSEYNIGPANSLLTRVQSTASKLSGGMEYGAGPIEKALELNGIESDLGARKAIAYNLRKKFKRLNDEEIAEMIMSVDKTKTTRR